MEDVLLELSERLSDVGPILGRRRLLAIGLHRRSHKFRLILTQHQ